MTVSPLKAEYLDDVKTTLLAVGGLLPNANVADSYLIHCVEGKDRTGFICALILGLVGGSYQDIAQDYLLTYDNYFKINELDDVSKQKTYNLIQEILLKCNTLSIITGITYNDNNSKNMNH